MSTEGTVLVTGGAGYIGSHTARALRNSGRDIVVLDSLELGTETAVMGAPLVVGNIADSGLVQKTCKRYGITQVVHFAAYKSVAESMRHPAKYWRNNVANAATLAEACLEEGVTQLVFSSSCSVVGTPRRVPVTESAPICPESVYAETKATVERILHWYGVTNGLRTVSLRYFNAAGASLDGRIGEDWTHSSNLIPLVMKAVLLKNQPVSVFGNDYDTPDGTCIRDYVHVEDLADAHVRALQYLAEGGDAAIVNLGTGVGSSVTEVIDVTASVADRDVPYEIKDRRDGDPVAVYAQPNLAQEVLGWRARHGLKKIVQTAYDWHRQAAVAAIE